MKRVAVIGLGNIARRHRRNLRQLYPDARLYAMSASGRKPEADVADCDELVASLDALLEQQIEMVIVASPAPFHARHTLPLLQAGIPVLIEKPVAASISDARAIMDAEQQSQTPVAVGYCLRYLPSAQKMHELLARKVLGELYHASVEVGQYLPGWRPLADYRDSVSANAHLGGGALLELSHELDYSQWLLGKLSAKYALLSSSTELGLEVEDAADIMAVSEQGAVVSIHLDFLQRQAYRRCRFVGPLGALEWDLLANTITVTDREGTRVLYSEPLWDKNQMYLEMLRDFERKIRGQDSQCVTATEAMTTVCFVADIRHAALA